MKRLPILLLLLAAAPEARAQDAHASHDRPAAPLAALATADSIAFAAKVATGNLVGVTITNYGFIGNNFISRDPSLEYPLGAGYEHMVRGGLWVGGVANTEADGTFTGVVTGALDGSQG